MKNEHSILDVYSMEDILVDCTHCEPLKRLKSLHCKMYINKVEEWEGVTLHRDYLLFSSIGQYFHSDDHTHSTELFFVHAPIIIVQ